MSIILIIFLLLSCDDKAICLDQYKELQRNQCNIVVTKNITRTSKFAHNNLKLEGKKIENHQVILFDPSPRAWNSLSDYISIGDTVLKNYGEAIMYVYKKDSIIEMNLVDICEEDFDWDNFIKITLRKSKLN